MEKTISSFHASLYIPTIQKLASRLPRVHIIGTNHCGAMQRTAFKQRELFQDVLCGRDYADRLVASFAHQIQSKYYGAKYISVYRGYCIGTFWYITRGDINSIHHHVNVIQCVTFYYLIIANRILPLLPHTEIV